jgi:hypothetical protein
VGLEIEIEYDDPGDAEWDDDGDRGRPYRRRRTPLPRVVALPRPGLVLAVSVAVVGVAAAAGLNIGLTAPQDRARVALHLASSDSYLVDAPSQPVPVPLAIPTPAPGPASGRPTGPLATRSGTTHVDRTVWLKVINDGPRAVTVLGATLSSPDLAASRLVPEGAGVLKPGAVGTLRGRAQFSCGGGLREGADATFAEVAFATVADIEMRTADGRLHQVRIIVEQYSADLVQAECGWPVSPKIALVGSGIGPREL